MTFEKSAELKWTLTGSLRKGHRNNLLNTTKTKSRRMIQRRWRAEVRGLWGAMKRNKRNSWPLEKGLQWMIGQICAQRIPIMLSTDFFFCLSSHRFPIKKNLIPNKIHFGNGCGKQTVIPLFGFYSKVYKSHERMLTDPKVTLGKTVLTVMS